MLLKDFAAGREEKRRDVRYTYLTLTLTDTYIFTYRTLCNDSFLCFFFALFLVVMYSR